MDKKRKIIVLAILFVVIAVIYTLLVKTVDVQVIGPRKSSVGFATLNDTVKGMVGRSDFWYKVTKYLGIVPFLMVAFYGLHGLIQLMKYKSILKVDKKLLYLGGLYVLLGCVYIFFEKVVINYRPVLLDGELEASYPSSHTMLALTICLSSLLISKYYIKNKNILLAYNIGTILLMLLLVVGRILSGVHWISDIIGGVLISVALVSIYYACIQGIKTIPKNGK